MAALTDRASKVTSALKELNGAEAISLINFLLLTMKYDRDFVENCEHWMEARE
jgi:hypothetical protein